MRAATAPNRPLDLDELDEPAYERRLARMEELLAAEAGAYLHPSKRWEYNWALDRADLSRGARVLDAGAGGSIFPVYLADRGYRPIGLDVSLERRLGRSSGLDVPYVEGDLTAIPLRTGGLDAAFCISVIEHLPGERIPAALRELRRVLRPGGRLLLTTDFYRDASADLWYERGGERFPVDWGVFDLPRLRRLILAAPGWRVEGELDLDVDWDAVEPRMRAFHGYPYTSIGVALVRA